MRIGLTDTGTEWKHQNYVRWIAGGEAIEVVRLSAALGNLNLFALMQKAFDLLESIA